MNQATSQLIPFTPADLHTCTAENNSVFRLVEEALQDRRKAEREKQRIEFLHRVLANASTTLDTHAMLELLGRDLASIAPVAEVMATFTQDNSTSSQHEFVIASTHDAKETATRRTMLLRALDQYTGQGAGLLQPAGSALMPGARSGWAAETIYVPLQTNGRTFGVVGVITTKTATAAQNELIRTACAHITQPLANAREFTRMRALASHDGLTGLHNRRAFDERLDEEISRHARANGAFSLLLLDIDHFKNINDTYGHEAGDEILRNLADIINQTIRLTDFGARFGGEEFAVLLPSTTPEQAQILAERLRQKVENSSVLHAGKHITITISIGVSCYDAHHTEDAPSLVRRADTALYQAKNNGRNRVQAAHRAA